MTPPIGRPLWQLLLSILEQKPDIDFTCAECFHMLEYLADIKAQDVVDSRRLRELIRRHLAVFPECIEHYARLLAQMESQVV